MTALHGGSGGHNKVIILLQRAHPTALVCVVSTTDTSESI